MMFAEIEIFERQTARIPLWSAKRDTFIPQFQLSIQAHKSDPPGSHQYTVQQIWDTNGHEMPSHKALS